jgi:hypothetical protein
MDENAKATQVLRVGIVSSIGTNDKTGTVLSAGDTFNFEYSSGRGIVFGDELDEPIFALGHAQPASYELKYPRSGDPLVFVASAEHVVAWAYASHYVSAVERVCGTDFVASN